MQQIIFLKKLEKKCLDGRQSVHDTKILSTYLDELMIKSIDELMK